MLDDKEMFIMLIIGLRIIFKYFFRIIVGKGFNEYDLVDDFLIIDFIWDVDIKLNLDNDER